MKAWSRATVISINTQDADDNEANPVKMSDDPFEGLKVEIKYELDRKATIRTFDLSTYSIAPLGTFTNDFNWRYDLKIGDHVDCLDEEKDWYKSTIIGQRIIMNEHGEKVPELFVGFRTYDEEGSKEDEQGQKFFGWSDRYDVWFAVTDVQV